MSGYLVLAWLWPLEQVPGQLVWLKLALGSSGPGLSLLGDQPLPRLASWGSVEAFWSFRQDQLIEQLGPDEGFLEACLGMFGQ